MIARLRFVAQDMNRAPVGRDRRVEAPVIVDVTNRQAASYPRLLESGTGVGGNIDERLAVHVPREQHGLPIVYLGGSLLNGIQIVALRDEQVFPTIVVVVEEADTPPGMQQGHARDSS